jgi:5-methylcytosine-specific restriction endonuclease McrA
MTSFTMKRPCLEPRCPGYAVHRGRCELHKRNTAQRGYGRAWQATSRALRRGAVCVSCGTTRDLTVDHVTPGDASVLRVLCRSCHGRIGARSSRRGGRGPIVTIYAFWETCTPLREKNLVSINVSGGPDDGQARPGQDAHGPQSTAR